MAIVPIRDEYTDTAVPGHQWAFHTPVSLGNGAAVLITKKVVPEINYSARLSIVSSDDAPAGVQARVYTITDTGWTRGDPISLPVDCTTAHASAATLDGNVLIQGTVDVLKPVTIPGAIKTAVGYGPYDGNDLPRMRTPTPATTASQRIRVSSVVSIVGLWFGTYASDSTDTVTWPTLRVSICAYPDGSGIIGQSNVLTVGRNYSGYWADLSAELSPGLDYYVVFTRVDGFDLARLWETQYGSATTHEVGDYRTSVTPRRYYDGTWSNSLSAIFIHADYQEPSTTTITPVQESGYAVLDVQGTTIVPGAVTAVAGESGPATLGACYTAPDAMVRIPLTNKFWAWRYYPTPGLAYLDLIQVTGTKVTVLGSAAVGAFSPQPYIPHQIIPLGANQAISMLSMPGSILLVHAVVSGTTVTVTTHPTNDYPDANGATLVPGLNHHAELLVQADTSDPLKLNRVGLNWATTAFTITSLPITQLTAGIKPPNYSPRNKSAHISIMAGSTSVVLGGSALVVARQYIDNGSDDNWTLLTEYNQADGTIVTSTWAKGDRNGAKVDLLTIDGAAIRWDAGAERLLYAATEPYAAGGNTMNLAQPSRLGVYRVSYVVDANARSKRQSFER